MTKDFQSLKIEKGTSLLPIGTVVDLIFVEQVIMIYGRKQEQANTGETWDYVGCPYPQGHISNETNVFFQHDQIAEVIFKGLETEGEKTFRQELENLFSKDEQ